MSAGNVARAARRAARRARWRDPEHARIADEDAQLVGRQVADYIANYRPAAIVCGCVPAGAHFHDFTMRGRRCLKCGKWSSHHHG